MIGVQLNSYPLSAVATRYHCKDNFAAAAFLEAITFTWFVWSDACYLLRKVRILFLVYLTLRGDRIYTFKSDRVMKSDQQ